MEIQYSTGGWRCNKFSFGRGSETEFSNPGPTLTALDAFRFTDLINKNASLDRVVEFLLVHWGIRQPLALATMGYNQFDRGDKSYLFAASLLTVGGEDIYLSSPYGSIIGSQPQNRDWLPAFLLFACRGQGCVEFFILMSGQ